MSEHTTPDGSRRIDAEPTDRLPAASHGRLRWGAYLIAVAGAMFVVHGIGMLYRAYFGSGFELGVHTLGGVTRGELAVTNPELLSYVDHLHVNVAALMIALGLAVIALAWYGIRSGQRWAWATAIGAPVVFLAFSLSVHQTVAFSFDAVLHLGPAGVGVPIFLAGIVLAHQGLRDAAGSPSGGA